MPNNLLSSLGMQDAIWKLYRTDDPYLYEKRIEIPYMRRFCYETIHDGRTVTLGLYKYNGTEIFKAWGYKDEEHCSYHAIKIKGEWSEVIEGCPQFKLVIKDEAVIGFTLTHTKVHSWIQGAYKENDTAICCSTVSNVCIAEDEKEIGFRKTLHIYTPLILLVLLSTLGGVFTTFLTTKTISDFLMSSMGYFITVIGLLKIVDIKTFSEMFKQYDPLAKFVPVYASLYPLIETTLGMLILMRLFMVQAHLAVICIYSITTIGILISMRNKRKLDCGCLGGGAKLPLSKVTVVENVAMIAMAIYTISFHL